MSYLLEDITVVDAATYLAGPGAATIMADFGANVIKIEPPGGDGYRQLVGRYPVPYHWLLTSRNKKSLAVDLTKDAGQQLMHDIIAKADVFTTNFLEAQRKKYRLDYEQLKGINPRLIYAYISGYGTQGPEVNRRAFDVTAWWARSGLMEFIRDPGQQPLRAAPGMGDHATASAFFGAIMTGLYRREKTGEGCFVSTSLAANGVWANGMALQGVVAGNDIATHRQEKGWVNPFTSAYRSKDGKYLVFAIINAAREYPQLCEALNRNDWLSDERFADIRTLMKHREEFEQEVQAEIGTMTFDDVCSRLDNAGVTYGPASTMSDVIADEQLRANDIIVETDDPGEDYRFTIGSPVNILEEEKRKPTRAPDIGANSLEVLRDVGLDESRIQELVKAGIVVLPVDAAKDS